MLHVLSNEQKPRHKITQLVPYKGTSSVQTQHPGVTTVRLEELKAQAAGLIRAWNWARGWAPILKACPNESSLNIALQLYKTQKPQFAVFTDAIAWVVQIGRQQREYLRGCNVVR